MPSEPTSTPARILVVDDDRAIRKIIKDRFAALGHVLDTANDGQEAVAKLDTFAPDLMLLDLRMPNLDGFGVLRALRERSQRPEVIMLTAHGSIEAAVQAVQLGATDFIQKPFDTAHLELVVHRTLAAARLRQRVDHLQTELSGRHSLIAGQSEAMRQIVRTAERAAPSEATVLLLGESGSGKEVMARFIHQHSPRVGGPFVALNCATLSGELLASELFGHERGAFTGAVKDKPGRLEQAAGGTLFLDEIGELSADLQAKLLRVLQEREFERVGGTRVIRADVRVVAATHRNLAEALRTGTFREDLYYRLNVVSLRVPPLRDRRQDLPALLSHFLARHAGEAARPRLSLSEEANRALLAYDWPGNVRELSNAMERCVVLAEGDRIEVGDLPEEVRDVAGTSATRSNDPGAQGVDFTGLSYHDAVAEAKRHIITAALSETSNHQTRAAELLGLTQPYLARLMKNLGMRLKK
ncbi:MAG: sigma-54 dependent transcriptional regulator [Myxococcales bacterium]|nr:sigma-54 dependent transcriptional regulator [Myxococcales bacterium]MDD9967822.1 sigma-54 dependent transcriptional regulator [Myxococcales bacterium]